MSGGNALRRQDGGPQVVIPFGVPNGSILGCFFFKRMFHILTDWKDSEYLIVTWYDCILNDIHGEFLDQSYFWIKVIHWIFQNQQYFSSFIYDISKFYMILYMISNSLILRILMVPFYKDWIGRKMGWDLRNPVPRCKAGLLLWRFVDFER